MHPSPTMSLQLLFWLAVAGAFYAYVAYPALVYLAARVFGRQPQPPAINLAQAPTVSLVIAALNEESVLEERIENFLALDYPPDRLELLLASDGSTDGT